MDVLKSLKILALDISLSSVLGKTFTIFENEVVKASASQSVDPGSITLACHINNSKILITDLLRREYY